MEKLVFLLLFTLCNCLTIPDDGTTTPAVTATEAPVELLIMDEEGKLDKAYLASEDKDPEEEEKDSAKTKRTLEGMLGYGNEGGVRFNRQLSGHGRVRAYFIQTPSQQHAYRHYAGQVARDAAQPIQNEAHQHHHQPHTTIPLPDVGVPPEYITKAGYHQSFRPSPAIASLFSTASSHQTSPFFRVAPHTAGQFYSIPTLAASPHFLTAANPFLTVTPVNNFLSPHAASTDFALLQNPSNPYGAQIFPVIILRVAPGVEHSGAAILQHPQQSVAYPHSSAGLNLHYKQPQIVLENPQQPSHQNQQQQSTYQDDLNTQYIHQSQKNVYKKPVVSTQPQTAATKKSRKNGIVVNEQSEPHSEVPYSQYKYISYKEKA